jgi:hypothetical protein
MKTKLTTALLIAMGAIALLATQAPAQSARPALYRGKSNQGRPIQFSTSQNQITLIRFKVKMLCRDGSLLFGDASDFEASALRANGAFADVQYGNTDTVSFKGRLKGGKLKGTLRVKDRLKSGVRCDSQPVSFTAKRAGG